MIIYTDCEMGHGFLIESDLNTRGEDGFINGHGTGKGKGLFEQTLSNRADFARNEYYTNGGSSYDYRH